MKSVYLKNPETVGKDGAFRPECPQEVDIVLLRARRHVDGRPMAHQPCQHRCQAHSFTRPLTQEGVECVARVVQDRDVRDPRGDEPDAPTRGDQL